MFSGFDTIKSKFKMKHTKSSCLNSLRTKFDVDLKIVGEKKANFYSVSRTIRAAPLSCAVFSLLKIDRAFAAPSPALPRCHMVFHRVPLWGPSCSHSVCLMFARLLVPSCAQPLFGGRECKFWHCSCN